MHMVPVGIDGEEMECRVLLDCSIETFQQILLNHRNDEFSPIFGAPDDVILQLIDTVVEASDSHATRLARYAC